MTRGMGDVRRSKEWKERVARDRKDRCEWCGGIDRLSLHHQSLDAYASKEAYLTSTDVITLCRRCHWAVHRYMTLCPVCKTNYRQATSDMCTFCKNGIPVEQRGARKRLKILLEARVPIPAELLRSLGVKNATDGLLYHPKSTLINIKRSNKGECEFKCKSCEGEPKLCGCGRLLCRHHMEAHWPCMDEKLF